MVGLVLFHVLMLGLGLGIGGQVVPVERVSDLLGYLHNSIGISTPPLDQVRTIALIWIGSAIIIVDASVFFLIFITKLLH
jgi:hypothetical protein